MKRVYILCKGQTEETFVNAVLSPYFTPQDIYVTPVILATKRIASGGKYRGGVSSYDKISKDLKLLCRDGEAYVTSLLDYFALPEDTPGFLRRLRVYMAISRKSSRRSTRTSVKLIAMQICSFMSLRAFCSPHRRNLPLSQSKMRLMLFALFVKNTPIPRRSIHLSIRLRRSVSLQ